MSDADARAEELLDEYVAALERGEAIDPDAFLARHQDAPPGLRDDLRMIASLHNAAHSLAEDTEGLAEPSAAEVPAGERALLEPGTRLGECIVQEIVGYGGMGEVYLALHEGLGREVAVKVLRRHLADDPGAVARFRQEVEALDRVGSHDNIVTAMPASEDRGLLYLVMEYVPGVDLQRRVADGGPLPVETACDYVRQAALGLAHAHKHGIVHRDVKPSNLLLTADGTVKLLDLGLARLALRAPVHDSSSRPVADELVGSLDYMAPEQAEDPDRADGRSDLYALGCTFYYLLAGRPPFADRLMLKKLMAHAVEKPEPIRKLRAEVPPAVEAVLDRLLVKDPARRFASGRALADALDAALRGRRPSAPPAEGGPTDAGRITADRARPAAPARPAPFAALAIAVLVAAAAGALAARFLWPAPEPPPPDGSDPETEPAPPPAAVLAVGSPVQGELADGDAVSPKSAALYDSWPLLVERGGVYVITLRSREVDPQLVVSDRWARLESDDAPGLGTTAQVVWEASEAGTVEVLAAASGPAERGGYQLFVERTSLVALAVGTPVEGTLAEGDALLPQDGSLVDRYRLAVTGGETYIVRMTAEAFEPYVFVADDETEALPSEREHTERAAHLIYTASDNGTVYVAANAWQPGGAGRYRLEVEQPAIEGDVVRSVRGRLEESDSRLPDDQSFYDAYPLEVRAGHTYVITLRSEELNAYLLLEGPGHRRLAMDDGALGNDARIVHVAPENAALQVLANSQRPGETGAYSLEIREAAKDD